MTTGEKINKLRKEKGYSQEELSLEIDVSRQAISKWERGESLPDTDKLIRLSEVFGVSIDYILKDDNLKEDLPNINFNKRRNNTIGISHFSKLIKKHGHIAGYIISLYGIISLILSQIAVYISKKILSPFDTDGFSQLFEASNINIFNPVAFLGNIISIIGILLIILGVVLAMYIKKKNKN